MGSKRSLNVAGSMVGRVFNNRYKITERVGLGGMAEVYRAQDNVLGRMVAVKVMLPQYAADPNFTKRFRQEAASAAKLQSPYIVSIYDWGQDDETYYIVMEYLRGTDLKTAILERGCINQRKAAEIGSQVAQALSVAHASDIIHRDIKPQNIMIQPDGNIKVMDFGIARAGDAGLSQTATVLGTAHYVSPEQAQGKDLTPASDIYSLGVVLYEATTGRLPFDGTDAVSVAVKQVNEIPAAPHTINPDIDPTLEAIIMKALEKDPTKRFQNASDMRLVLNDYLAGRPVNLGDDINGLKTQVMNGVIPPISDSTAVMPVQNIQNATDATGVQTSYRTNNEPEKKSKKGLIIGGIVALIAVIIIAISVITLTNQGDTVEVPNVSNQSVETARQTLRSAGFEVGAETEVYSTNVASGNVVSTNPEAGQKAKKGSKVDISISKGTEQVSVPDLSGMTKDEAQKALTAAGLVGKEGDAVYSDTDENKVAQQEAAAGTKVNKGDTVTFHLSKGPEMVSIPNVVGATEASASSSLSSAGFTVHKSYDYSSTVAEGRVISQSDTGQAKKGSTITITISNGPESTVSVPSVVGKTQSAAETELSNAGLRYDVQTSSSSTVAKGTVISQSPSSGTVAKGTTVTIIVSSGPSS